MGPSSIPNNPRKRNTTELWLPEIVDGSHWLGHNTSRSVLRMERHTTGRSTQRPHQRQVSSVPSVKLHPLEAPQKSSHQLQCPTTRWSPFHRNPNRVIRTQVKHRHGTNCEHKKVHNATNREPRHKVPKTRTWNH